MGEVSPQAKDDKWPTLADRLAAMARDLLAQESVQDTVDRISAHAVALIDGCDAAGILTLRRRAVTTIAATDDVVRASDAVQGELREGPCFDVVTLEGSVQHIPDLREAGDSWPRYAPRAVELGLRSAMGFRLFDRHNTLGALNVYSFAPNAFTPQDEHLGWLLASHAAVAFAHARTEDQLQTALRSRDEIGQAIGIVRERFDLRQDQAFAVLKRTSQDLNVKLREIAERIVRGENLPH
ncbi:GAF and ANTAR domain-containing protein [Streptomyces sp. B3I8]|uniref:GAF and ANTAR domain-containing protein n=1 Tax=Streptomyces sp. B3I8 TaxID=3042303 RepID=UPI00277FED8C|nr:GAF and ANTAR domain-containing protein [Streptomyces sp. B3I8]MDQ0785418.1 GAF domain-containing protein [Streptomyces sp. B3I8]